MLAEESADQKTPYEIEEYLLNTSILKSRVVDFLKNYRREWRNPSTHDYKLFFSEQESYLAIINVSAFVSILVDQMVEKLTYSQKYVELESAAILAREGMQGFDSLAAIDKVYKILMSYSVYYIKNFEEMSKKERIHSNAEMAAFIQRVAPSFKVKIEPDFTLADKKVSLDFIVNADSEDVAIEARAPRPSDAGYDDAAINQLSEQLRETGIKNGVVFFYPGKSGDITVATTSSTIWPPDLNLREVFSDDPLAYELAEIEEPVDLIVD